MSNGFITESKAQEYADKITPNKYIVNAGDDVYPLIFDLLVDLSERVKALEPKTKPDKN